MSARSMPARTLALPLGGKVSTHPATSTRCNIAVCWVRDGFIVRERVTAPTCTWLCGACDAEAKRVSMKGACPSVEGWNLSDTPIPCGGSICCPCGCRAGCLNAGGMVDGAPTFRCELSVEACAKQTRSHTADSQKSGLRVLSIPVHVGIKNNMLQKERLGMSANFWRQRSNCV